MSANKMPVLFIGHGSPMNAIELNPYSQAWIDMGLALPRPKAILCISAHWETPGSSITAEENPRTIYDFYGFPPELYEVSYAAPGAPALASQVQGIVQSPVRADLSWGLDHGAWSVLTRLYPEANIPVVQLSLNRAFTPQQHYDLARQLKPLREEGVLIVGSGNMVHNLRVMRWSETAYEWAEEFDRRLKGWIETGDHDSIIHYERAGTNASLSIPTNEHYLPLLYALALQEKNEGLNFLTEGITLGSISMRSVLIG